MNDIFGSIGDIIRGLLKIIPRPQVIESTHGGIAFVRGRARAIPFGGCWYWYWPIWTELLVFPIVRQTLNLPSQVLMPKPLRNEDPPTALAVSGIVVYAISDPVKSWGTVHELDDAIADLALASIKHVLSDYTIREIRTEQTKIDRAITTDLRRKLRGRGVEVQNVFLSDAAPCEVIRVLGNGPVLLRHERSVEADA